MEGQNQEADQMQLHDDLASLVVEDAEPFRSQCSQVNQATGAIPAQHTPLLEPRSTVAMPSQAQPQTGMSSSFSSQSGLSERLPEVQRASPVHQRAVDEPAFLANIPDISDEEIEHYRDQFEGDLKSDILDAMIIYQEDDLDDVLHFLSRVDSDVRLKNGEKPKVVLHTEVRPDINTPVGQLDKSLPLCTYIFLYVTKKFCADGWTEFSSQVCLMESIYNPEKKWSVVPIFTESKNVATYKVPASINSLTGIQYWNKDKFYADSLRELLERKLHVRENKEDELKHRRKLWIIQKKAEEIREAKRREQEIQHALAEESLQQASAKDHQEMILGVVFQTCSEHILAQDEEAAVFRFDPNCTIETRANCSFM